MAEVRRPQLPARMRRVVVGLALVGALAAGAALAQAAPGEHVVEPGDTLSSLARRFDTSVAELRRRNGLTGDLLRVGETLRVAPRAGFRTHRAGPNVDWAVLAEQLGPSVASLRSANPDVASPGGREIRVPPGDGRTVWPRAGDDALALASRHGVAPSALMRANGWSGPGEVAPSDPVFLPGSTPREGASAGEGGVAAGGAGPTDAARAPAAVDTRAWHRQAQAEALSRFAGLAAELEPPDEGYRWPLAGRLSSPFGWRAISVNGNRYHLGLDVAADAGTPVRAARAGRVTRAGWVGAYGYAVYVDHEGGAQTRYAHLSLLDVTAGERLAAGDVLGRVGSSGASTGPHLHFEVRLQGRAVDPLSLLPARQAGAPPR